MPEDHRGLPVNRDVPLGASSIGEQLNGGVLTLWQRGATRLHNHPETSRCEEVHTLPQQHCIGLQGRIIYSAAKAQQRCHRFTINYCANRLIQQKRGFTSSSSSSSMRATSFPSHTQVGPVFQLKRRLSRSHTKFQLKNVNQARQINTRLAPLDRAHANTHTLSKTHTHTHFDLLRPRMTDTSDISG